MQPENHTTNQIFKEHFSPAKLTDSMAAEIIADQERIDQERIGRRRSEEDNGKWAGLTHKGD